MESLEITKDFIVNLYQNGNEEVKNLLTKRYGAKMFAPFDYRDIKTLNDVFEHLREIEQVPRTFPYVIDEISRSSNALNNLLSIARALNNGKLFDDSGKRYCPFWKFSALALEDSRKIKPIGDKNYVRYSGVCVHNCDNTMNFPVSFNSEEKAEYAAKQFESIFFKYYMIELLEEKDEE